MAASPAPSDAATGLGPGATPGLSCAAHARSRRSTGGACFPDEPGTGGGAVAVVAAVIGVALILTIVWEGFEVIILPRRVTRRFRFTLLFYRFFWRFWKAVGSRLVSKDPREAWLGVYGPLSLLLLLSLWAGGIILGFALLYWAAGSSAHAGQRYTGFATDAYFSGSTFFTLGLGDVTPRVGIGRLLAVVEAGLGFGFLALIFSYLPPLNQSFSRREVSVSLLDARAGSPPSAAEMLRRHRGDIGEEALRGLLAEWERWSAELLESHQSYPVLAYFRSQHENQSWLGALTAVLDTCALVMVGLEGACRRQAELTFAVARHAVVDLCLVFRRRPQPPAPDRLPPETLAHLRQMLTAVGIKLREPEVADQELAELRRMYEPYVSALASHFSLELPPWVPGEAKLDDWQVSEWEAQRGGR